MLGDLADAQEALPATLMAHSSEGRFAGRVIAPGHVALVQVLLSLPSEEFLGLHCVCGAPGGKTAVPGPQGVQGLLQGAPRCKRGALLLLLKGALLAGALKCSVRGPLAGVLKSKGAWGVA